MAQTRTGGAENFRQMNEQGTRIARKGSNVATGKIPLDHGARRVMLVLDENTINECLYDLEPEAKGFLFDPQSHILQYPLTVDEPDSQALQNIIDADLLRPGAVLLQSPYDRNAYVDLSQATDQFAIEKLRHFSRLCQYLGARDVTVEQVEVSKDSSSQVYELHGKAPVAKLDVKVENKVGNSLARKFSINASFRGGKPNTEAAEKYLRGKQLWGDVVMRSLVEQCADEDNQILEQKVVISLSSESKRSLGVVAKLNLPAKGLGLTANYLDSAHSIEEYLLTLTVKFDSPETDSL
ncbi:MULTISPECIES: hypothetical protein [Pseudomonas]|nr:MULTISPECIES: hypothetical protein [Pseudomonas]